MRTFTTTTKNQLVVGPEGRTYRVEKAGFKAVTVRGVYNPDRVAEVPRPLFAQFFTAL
jgi:hypothetical protein